MRNPTAALVASVMILLGGLRPAGADLAPDRPGGRHVAAAANTVATAGGPQRFVRPVEGSLVLPADGPVHPAVLDVFVYLTGTPTPTIAVIGDGPDAPDASAWAIHQNATVQRIAGTPARSDRLTMQLLDADGIWFAGDAPSFIAEPLLQRLVDVVLARGGVVGGTGDAARERLPDGRIESWGATGAPPPGQIVWRMESGTAIVVHEGRRLMGYGAGGVRATIGGGGEADASAIEFELNSIDAFDRVDPLSWELDLMALRRVARDQTAPPRDVAEDLIPELANGTLILHGGRGVDDPTFKRFMAAAGGPDAAFVCLPVAQSFDAMEAVTSYSARRLRELGATDVTVLHTADPRVADTDARFLAALERAGGVWIDGGRTFRAMDALQDTRAAELIAGVLDRGGVVGGSSAGCQVAGDFLVRGDPRTNQVLAFPGYTTGLRLLPGVAMDAHFRQRDRGGPFGALMTTQPSMLGIGVDENTAIVVTGREAEVVGDHAVTFYDVRSPDARNVHELTAGRRFDLVDRRTLD